MTCDIPTNVTVVLPPRFLNPLETYVHFRTAENLIDSRVIEGPLAHRAAELVWQRLADFTLFLLILVMRVFGVGTLGDALDEYFAPLQTSQDISGVSGDQS